MPVSGRGLGSVSLVNHPQPSDPIGPFFGPSSSGSSTPKKAHETHEQTWCLKPVLERNEAFVQCLVEKTSGQNKSSGITPEGHPSADQPLSSKNMEAIVLTIMLQCSCLEHHRRRFHTVVARRVFPPKQSGQQQEAINLTLILIARHLLLLYTCY